MSNLTFHVGYIFHIYLIEKSCGKLPKMLTYLLVIFLGISYIAKQRFPCVNMILNAGYYFQIYHIECMGEIYT